MQFCDLWMKMQYDVQTKFNVLDDEKIYFAGSVGEMPVLVFEKVEFAFIEKIYVVNNILYIVLEDE